MVPVRQEAASDVDATRPSPSASSQADSLDAVDWAISRRGFFMGAGVTLASASALGPWLKKAKATTNATALPAGFTTGVSDTFDRLARQGGEVALTSFDALVAANADSLRFPIDWARVQPQEGGFDWSSYDALYEVLVFHGLKAHPVIIGCPAWLGADQRKRAPNGVYYPTGGRALEAYGALAVETAQHFTCFGDHIDAIEVWSEPNNPRGSYIADPSDFSRMLASVAGSIERANANGDFSRAGEKTMTVLSGGLYAAPDDHRWEQYLAAFQDQAAPYQLGLHAPASTVKGGASAPANYALLRSAEEIGAVVDRAASRSDREIWVTGTGASAQPPWGERGQAFALASIAGALAKRSQCRAMMVTGTRAGTSPQASALETPLPMSSLLLADGKRTSALATLQTAWATAT